MIETNIPLTTLQIITAVVMVLGLFSLIIPGIPGLTIIWISALIFAVLTGFSWQVVLVLLLLTLMMIGGNLVDNLLMGAGARKHGASWQTIGLALLAGVAGTLILPPFGGFVAALLAMFGLEYVRLNDWRKALDATGSMAMGCGWSVIVRFIIGVMMVGVWALWAHFLV